KYRELVENVNDVIYAVDESGVTTYISPIVESVLGYSASDLVGRSFAEFVHPDDLQYASEGFLNVLSGNSTTGEYRLLTKSGEIRWMRTSNRPMFKENRVIGATGVLTDITERKRAEERIEHLNTVLRAIRNVNQLIAGEKDSKRLIKGACNELVETRGYFNAWIAMLDESGRLVTTAEAGMGKDFKPIVEMLKRGELPDCGRRALKQSGVIIIEDPPSTCVDCPLAQKFSDRGTMTVRLEYGGKVHGLMSVSIPRDLAADEEEQTLFRE
ncbi:unnamed protein product, partial [marine sediment metagenome]